MRRRTIRPVIQSRASKAGDIIYIPKVQYFQKQLNYCGDEANGLEDYELSSDGSVDFDDDDAELDDEDNDDNAATRESQDGDDANQDLAALKESRTQDIKALVRLWRETVILQQQQSMTYTCHICLDEPRLDSGRAIRLSPCNHIMCRECLRNGVQSDLDERKYPLRCPDCTAEQRTVGDTRE